MSIILRSSVQKEGMSLLLDELLLSKFERFFYMFLVKYISNCYISLL